MDKFVPHRMEKLNVSLTISTLELSQKHFSNLAVLKAPVTACNWIFSQDFVVKIMHFGC